VGRTTQAINYRPRSGETRIDFEGTPLMADANGSARVKGEEGVIAVEAEFDDLEPASRFGREYLTYVLWAITPEGRATNLGELQVRRGRAQLDTTTELQAFGMIVTAEPYFAVTQPSDAVVLENVARKGTRGNVDVIQARYELMKRGSYLMNHDASRLDVKEVKPGESLDLAEARNAVALARLAGADEYASPTFDKATRLLADAEAARERRRGGNAVMMPARQAVQTAEDARIIAVQKQEEAFVARQRLRAEQLAAEAALRADTEAARRRLAEDDRLASERRARESDLARAAAERARLEADRQAESLARERAALEADRRAAETARATAEAGRAAAEADARALAERSEREKAELRDQIREQLDVILETRETARGLIVNLSDVLFDTDSANLRPGAREKVAKVAGVLLAYPGLAIEVDGHTDNVGDDRYNQRLSERRADSVRTYLVREGIPASRVTASGFGESNPVVSNDTSAGRQQNRRVELVVSGEAIGTAR
jgi:outer membrane protein OmpA-like peptidoglycan-associated protein